MSFEKAYEEFLNYAKKQRKKESFNTLQSVFKSRILPYFSDMRLDDISKKDVLNWTKEIEEKHFSNNYNKNCYYAFYNFLEYSVENFGFPKNYLFEIGKFKRNYETKKHDFYTYKEYKRFIKGFQSDEFVYKSFFEFMFFCGTRPGETFALQFKDFYGKYVSINKTLTSHNGREFDYPKTYSSFRKIYIDKKLRRTILELKKNYGSCNDDYFIFGGVKPLAPTTINRYKKKACNRVDIRPIKLHEFRHSHASLLVYLGISIEEVAKRLGHANKSTTLNVYVHDNFEQEKRVIKTLNSLRFNFFNTLQSVFDKIHLYIKTFNMF